MLFRSLALVRKGAKIRVIRNATVLEIELDSFSLKDENYESQPFENLKIEFTANGSRFFVRVVGPEFENSGYCHPHVDGDGSVCLGRASEGGGDDMINGAMETMDLLAAYDAIESLLHTYNPNSPFFRLSESTGYVCESCGYRSDEMCSCDNCGEYICEACHSVCG